MKYWEKEYGSFDICPICGWEDDKLQGENPDFRGGANEESLNEAKSNYKKIGAKNFEALADVRLPLPEEYP